MKDDRQRSFVYDDSRNESLDVLQVLPGTWANVSSNGRVNLPGRGWNMIALPFAADPAGFQLLMNQYDECLTFKGVDDNVPNRGIRLSATGLTQTDQFIVTVDYQQVIRQFAQGNRFADASRDTEQDLIQDIHHEPGLFLRMKNETTEEFNIARLGTIPHGNSLLALGKSTGWTKGAPTIPAVDGHPIGNRASAWQDRYDRGLFRRLFNPGSPADLLKGALAGVQRHFALDFDSEHLSGGVVNIPFIERQADTTSMNSTFWIEEVEVNGETRLQLQYLQVVILEFGPRNDGLPGPVHWPHVSINTMQKLNDDEVCVLRPRG